MAVTQPPHIVLLTSPGVGHVRPAAELARRLATDHGFTATIVTYTNHSSPTHSSFLDSLPPSITTTALPEVAVDDLPDNARIETRIFTVVRRTLPHLRDLLRTLRDSPAGVAAFLPDMLCPWALEAAVELGIPRYVFVTSNLMALASLLHLPELDRTTTCEYRDLPEHVLLPGCVPLRGADLIDTIQDRANPAYPLMVDLGRQYLLADGFIVNTFDAMEHETIRAFQELADKGVHRAVYAVSPFFRPCSDEVAAAAHSCLRWLDDQPSRSVLYVCFGSGGTLSTEQTAELAAGLESSGQRFLWVVRFPSDKDRSAGYFGSSNHNDDPLSYLPDGFVERTSGAGLAVPLWAPQVEILNHPSIGGFLSHCGWNSTLESAAAGVPMVVWPLFAEQRMNAVMLEARVGMALRPTAREDGVVPREEVAAIVKELMVGEKGKAARKKASEVQKGAAKAWAPDGPARKALEAVASKWKVRHMAQAV